MKDDLGGAEGLPLSNETKGNAPLEPGIDQCGKHFRSKMTVRSWRWDSPVVNHRVGKGAKKATGWALIQPQPTSVTPALPTRKIDDEIPEFTREDQSGMTRKIYVNAPVESTSPLTIGLIRAGQDQSIEQNYGPLTLILDGPSPYY